jgi:hypothetical protein
MSRLDTASYQFLTVRARFLLSRIRYPRNRNQKQPCESASTLNAGISIFRHLQISTKNSVTFGRNYFRLPMPAFSREPPRPRAGLIVWSRFFDTLAASVCCIFSRCFNSSLKKTPRVCSIKMGCQIYQWPQQLKDVDLYARCVAKKGGGLQYGSMGLPPYSLTITEIDGKGLLEKPETHLQGEAFCQRNLSPCP